MPEFAPQDYASAFSNVPDPTQAFTQGLQSGLLTQQGMLQQQMQQAQFGRLQQMQRATMQVAQNPTPASIAQLSIAFPEMSENFKRSFDMLTPAQQLARVNQASQVFAAANNGRPDIAAQLLREQAQALQNSGDDQGAQHQLRMADWAETHPNTFKATAGVMLAAAMGPDKFGQTFKDVGEEIRKQGLYPSDLQRAQAEADIKTRRSRRRARLGRGEHCQRQEPGLAARRATRPGSRQARKRDHAQAARAEPAVRHAAGRHP